MDQKTKDQIAQATKLIQLGAYEQALEIGHAITHPTAQAVVLGSAYMEIESFNEAQTQFLKAQIALPNDPSILEYLAFCKAYLNGGVYDAECQALIQQAFTGNRFFHDTYSKVVISTKTPVRMKRRMRFEWLCEQFMATQNIEGAVAECGCWRGASILTMCLHVRSKHSSFGGEGVHVFDSFEGLSAAGDKDPAERGDSREGSFAASLPDVQENLKEFAKIEFYKGWIPDRFEEVASETFRFVHVDVDLFQPTDDSIRFFYPRLVPGGRIVCDDYNWSGAKEAIDVFAREANADVIVSPGNQAMLIKP